MLSQKLQNNGSIPTIGYEITTADVRAVDGALEAGYRHVLCECSAQHAFIVSGLVARWLHTHRLQRRDLFITVKVNISNASRVGYHNQFCQVVRDMGCGHIDLLLLHNNMDNRYSRVQLTTSWKLLCSLLEEEQTTYLGVSNFSKQEVEDIVSMESHQPAVFLQRDLPPRGEEGSMVALRQTLAYCRYRQMCPLISIDANTLESLNHTQEMIDKMSKKYNRPVIQVIIRWLLQQNYGVVCKHTDLGTIENSFRVFDFCLKADDIQDLNEAEAQTWTV